MEKQYIRSERAHYMCPNMHFGILADINGSYECDKIRESLDTLAKAHPFLRSTICQEEDSCELYYKIHQESKIELQIKTKGCSPFKDYEELAAITWNVFEHGLLKVYCYPGTDSFQILFVAHHLLGDGRALSELVCEFADLYVDDVKPAYVEESLIQGIESLPPHSDLPGISRYLVHMANKQWRKENRQVSYEEYMEFAKKFVKENPVAYKTSKIQTLDEMKALCHEHQISINDYLLAKTYESANTNKIIIAADIRSELSCYHKGAMGNYATALGIVYKGKSKDVIMRAKAVHKKINSLRNKNNSWMLVLACYLNMDPTLIDAAAIASLGGFSSKAAGFVGGNMFGYKKRDGVSITNLGAIKNMNLKNAIFIPPASPATKETIGVLTVNDTMNLCSSYYIQKNCL